MRFCVGAFSYAILTIAISGCASRTLPQPAPALPEWRHAAPAKALTGVYAVTGYSDDAVDVYSYPGFAYEYSYNRGLRTDYSVKGIAQTQ